MVGLDGLEPSTPALSRRCSNQLSYRPRKLFSPRALTSKQCSRTAIKGPLFLLLVSSRLNKPISVSTKTKQIQDLIYFSFSRKEVIQPHLPIRLPCYDFTPVMNPTVVTVLLAVRLATSGRTHSHGVTGGVYKTRERIHRGILIRDY
jgi:hypothetical protein